MKKLFISALSYVLAFVVGAVGLLAFFLIPFGIGYACNSFLKTEITNEQAGAIAVYAFVLIVGAIMLCVKLAKCTKEDFKFFFKETLPLFGASFVIGLVIIFVIPFAIGYFGNQLLNTSIDNVTAGAYSMIVFQLVGGAVGLILKIIEKIKNIRWEKSFNLSVSKN